MLPRERRGRELGGAMPFFGDEFIDVRSLYQGIGQRFLELDVSRLAILRDALANVRDRAILYFGVGGYFVSRWKDRYERPWEGELEIPANVTAWFEAGAEIEVDGRIVIHGGIVAPRQRIFREHESGMVIFAGEVDAILPEWWGASGDADDDPDGVNRDAIQRAIDAGSARRCPIVERRRLIKRSVMQPDGLTRVEQIVDVQKDQTNFRRPIPVLLGRKYTIRRPLRMGRPCIDRLAPPAERLPLDTPTVRAFGVAGSIATTLRGVTTGTATPSCGVRAEPRIFASDDPAREADAALLILDSAYAAIVEGLHLDGSGTANYGVIARTSPQFPTMRSFALRRCHLSGSRRGQVQIGPALDERYRDATLRTVTSDKLGTVGPRNAEVAIQVPVEGQVFSGGDLPGLSIEDNLIECPLPLGDARGADRQLSFGVQLRASNGVAVRVANNTFRGYAKTFIDAPATMALIEGCNFYNRHAPSRSPEERGDLGFEEADGEDVYLGTDRWVADRRGLEPEQFANRVEGAVAMVGCVSTSAQLFGTPRPGPLQNKRSERASLVLNAMHLPPRKAVASAASSTTSVYWGRFSPSIPRIVRVGSVARGLNPDPALSVVGSHLARGMTVGIGAIQSVVVACWMPDRIQQPRFVETRPGIHRPTVVFGVRTALMCLALWLLAGCAASPESSAYPPRDAGTDIVRDRVEADGGGSDVADAYSDAPIDRWWFSRDIVVPRVSDARAYEESMPPRQGGRSCPSQGAGDDSIPPPRLIFPMSPMRVTSRRPTLVWELAPGTTGARIELCRDPCCATPVASFDASGAQARPPETLPPGVVFWRARGMSEGRIGRRTSFTWEFSVRRRDLPSDTASGTLRDYNGDGFDDIATTSAEYLLVYWGGPDGLSSSRRQVVRMPSTGTGLASGDINGDGFADVVGTSDVPPDEAGRYYLARTWVAYGSPSGVVVRGDTLLSGLSWSAGVVDVNGDGFSDVVTQSPVPSPGSEMLFGVDIIYGAEGGLGRSGRQHLFNPSAPVLHGSPANIAASGDYDGDGYGDIAASDRSIDDGIGVVYIYRGHAGEVSMLPDQILRPERAGLFGMPLFGAGVDCVGDLNGDRREDLLVWEGRRDAVDLYTGGSGGILRHARRIVGRGPFAPDIRVGFGAFTATSPDIDADGHAELLVGCPACLAVAVDAGPLTSGRVYVFRDAIEQTDAYTWALDPPDRSDWGYYPTAIVTCDINGDGVDDIVIGDRENPDRNPDRGRIDYYLGTPRFGPGSRRSIYGEDLPSEYPGAIGVVLAMMRNLGDTEMENG